MVDAPPCPVSLLQPYLPNMNLKVTEVIFACLLFAVAVTACRTSNQETCCAADTGGSSTPDNQLTAREKAAGWRLLFDGKSADLWRSARSDGFPSNVWQIKDGLLTVLGQGGGEARVGGDIITRERFSNFELQVDFMRTPGCNSGIKIFVQPNLDPVTGQGARASKGSAIGLEYQILDDERHPDAKLGINGDRKLGALYDLVPAGPDKHPNPMGEWNHALIISHGRHVEHWLNGRKIVEYDRGSSAFRAAVAASKFRNIPGFGEWPDGHILLQEHGSEVSFKNIKILQIHT